MIVTILPRSFDPYVFSIEMVTRNPGIGCIWGLAFPWCIVLSEERRRHHAEPTVPEATDTGISRIGAALMLLDPQHARALSPHVDSGQVRSCRAVGLRDGAVLTGGSARHSRRAAEAMELRRHGFGKMKRNNRPRLVGPYVYSIERVTRNPGLGCIWSLDVPVAFCSRKNGGGTMLNRTSQKPRILAPAGLEPR